MNLQEAREVPERITAYLASGGLFNPELAEHQAVRDLLIDARESIRAAMAEVERLTAELEQYNELIFAVARKYPDETRHQTALRYIRQREQEPHGDTGAAQETKP